MSKKKILSEAQVRRFQGLAGIPALGETAIPTVALSEIGEGENTFDREEDDPPELPGDEGPEDELEMGVDLEPSDEGGELDLSPEQKEDLAADIVRAVAQELSVALELEEPIAVDAPGEEEMDLDMGDEELELDMGQEELPPEAEEPAMAMRAYGGADLEEAEEAEEAEEDKLEESDEDLTEVADDEALVNEVLRRVVARLSKKQ